MGHVEPITITSLALGGLGAIVGGLVEGNSDRIVCRIFGGVRDRVAGLRGLPENHDVARAVRTAQIQALDRLIGDFRDLCTPAQQRQADTFFQQSLGFCRRAIMRCSNPKVNFNIDVTELLGAAVDGILASPAHDGPADRRAAAISAFAEDAVLAELHTELNGVVLPDGFESHFRAGQAACARFMDLFGFFVAEQLKNNDRFRDIWTSGRLAQIEGATFDIAETLALLETRFGGALTRIEDRTRKIDATQDAHGAKLDEILSRLSHEKGVPIPPLRAILEKLGEAHVADDQLVARLEAKADEFIALREQWLKLTNAHPDVAAVRKKALARLDEGDLDGARDLLATARAHIRELRQERAVEEATLLADEAAIDRLQLDYRAAAEKFGEAANLVGFDPELSATYLNEQADALYLRGSEFGDNDALASCITLRRRALEQVHRETNPLDWATTQNNLGAALQALGARESGTARLAEAVAAYRAALEEWTRDRVPLAWAMTHNNLGAALQTLGGRENGTARLEEAVAAYRAALEERTRDRVPLDWAMTQNNLGIALSILGGRESGTARLAEAVAAYRAALEEYTRERVPLAWATTQNNLGIALWTLGGRESGSARLEEAIAACRAALEERTRERAPLDWATTQNNLGAALQTLGERESDTARLEEAVAAYRAALEELTAETHHAGFQESQAGLEKALALIAERSA